MHVEKSTAEIKELADRFLESALFHDRFAQLVEVATRHLTRETNDRFFTLLGVHGKEGGLETGLEIVHNYRFMFDPESQCHVGAVARQALQMRLSDLMLYYTGVAETVSLLADSVENLNKAQKRQIFSGIGVLVDVLYVALLFPSDQRLIELSELPKPKRLPPTYAGSQRYRI